MRASLQIVLNVFCGEQGPFVKSGDSQYLYDWIKHRLGELVDYEIWEDFTGTMTEDEAREFAQALADKCFLNILETLHHHPYVYIRNED